MIVAPSTGDRGGLEGLRQCVELVVDNVVPNDSELNTAIVVYFSETVEGSADGRFVKSIGKIPSWVVQ